MVSQLSIVKIREDLLHFILLSDEITATLLCCCFTQVQEFWNCWNTFYAYRHILDFDFDRSIYISAQVRTSTSSTAKEKLQFTFVHAMASWVWLKLFVHSVATWILSMERECSRYILRQSTATLRWQGVCALQEPTLMRRTMREWHRRHVPGFKVLSCHGSLSKR